MVDHSPAHYWWVSSEGRCMGAFGIQWNPMENTSYCPSCDQTLPAGTDWQDHPLKPETFALWRAWKDWDDNRRARARPPGTPPANP